MDSNGYKPCVCGAQVTTFGDSGELVHEIEHEEWCFVDDGQWVDTSGGVRDRWNTFVQRTVGPPTKQELTSAVIAAFEKTECAALRHEVSYSEMTEFVTEVLAQLRESK